MAVINIEKEIQELMKNHLDVEPPKMRDPWKEKQLDHKKKGNYPRRLNKELKSFKKAHYRALRNKNKRIEYDAMTLMNEELDDLHIPVFKKTSGWLTW